MKFSVIIPVYNKADTICSSLDSIIYQTYSDYEVIVVNDGSTDNLYDTIRGYNNIHYIEQPNSGVSAARNIGIKNASGDYICFLDADDLYRPNHLSVLSELIDKYPDCLCFCTSHVETTSDNTRDSSLFLRHCKQNPIRTSNLFYYLNSYSNSIVHTNSFCIKKDLFFEQGIFFAEGIKLGEDIDVWYRIALHNDIVLTKEVTTIYQHEYSSATFGGFDPNDWVFSNRDMNALLSGTSMSVQNEVAKLLDRYYLRCARYNKIYYHIRKSKINMQKVQNKFSIRYVYTLMFCLLPRFVSIRLKQ